MFQGGTFKKFGPTASFLKQNISAHRASNRLRLQRRRRARRRKRMKRRRRMTRKRGRRTMRSPALSQTTARRKWTCSYRGCSARTRKTGTKRQYVTETRSQQHSPAHTQTHTQIHTSINTFSHTHSQTHTLHTETSNHTPTKKRLYVMF